MKNLRTPWMLNPPQAGTTLLEAVMSIGLVGMVAVAVFAMNGQVMALVKSNQQTSASSLIIQQRAEQLRIATWPQVIDKTYLTTFMGNLPLSGLSIQGTLTEIITITAYPDSKAAMPIQIQRSGSGQITDTSSQMASTLGSSTSTSLASMSMVRVDFSLTYTGQNGQTRRRESSTLISRSGVSRMNLGYGSGGGTTTPTPTATVTPTPTATGSPTETPTPTPTATSGNGNNGNGNAHGTTGGNPGKK